MHRSDHPLTLTNDRSFSNRQSGWKGLPSADGAGPATMNRSAGLRSVRRRNQGRLINTRVRIISGNGSREHLGETGEDRLETERNHLKHTEEVGAEGGTHRVPSSKDDDCQCDPAEVGGETLAPPQLDVEEKAAPATPTRAPPRSWPGREIGSPVSRGRRPLGPFAYAAQRQPAPSAV